MGWRAEQSLALLKAKAEPLAQADRLAQACSPARPVAAADQAMAAHAASRADRVVEPVERPAAHPAERQVWRLYEAAAAKPPEPGSGQPGRLRAQLRQAQLQPLLQAQLQVRLQVRLQALSAATLAAEPLAPRAAWRAMRAEALEPLQAPQAAWQVRRTGAAQSLRYWSQANWRPGARGAPPAA